MTDDPFGTNGNAMGRPRRRARATLRRASWIRLNILSSLARNSTPPIQTFHFGKRELPRGARSRRSFVVYCYHIMGNPAEVLCNSCRFSLRIFLRLRRIRHPFLQSTLSIQGINVASLSKCAQSSGTRWARSSF